MSEFSLPDLVGLAVILLAVALFVSVLAERFGIPYVVALLLVALPFRLPAIPSNFAHTLQFVFLPALVFEAAWNIDVRILRKRAIGIALLAVPGVLFTAFAVAAGLSRFGLMPFLPALLLGAILSATDPIAVIAIFKKLGAPADLQTIVEGESLFNDGAAVVLYGIVVTMLLGDGHVSFPAIARSSFAVPIGGILVGLFVATSIAYFLRRVKDPAYEIVGTIVAAFGAYLIAEHLAFSGIFAAVAVGIAMRLSPRFPQAESIEDVDRFWGVISFLANAFVFVLMGLRIEFARLSHEPALVIGTLVLVSATRTILVFVAMPIVERGIERGWRTIVSIAGMRGALSIALAIGLPDSIPMRAQIVDAVFGVVSVTLVLQGLAIGPVLKRLVPPKTIAAT